MMVRIRTGLNLILTLICVLGYSKHVFSNKTNSLPKVEMETHVGHNYTHLYSDSFLMHNSKEDSDKSVRLCHDLAIRNYKGLKDRVSLDTSFTNNGHGVEIFIDSLNKQHLFIDGVKIEYETLIGLGDTLFYSLSYVTFNQYPSVWSIAIHLTDYPIILERYHKMHLIHEH